MNSIKITELDKYADGRHAAINGDTEFLIAAKNSIGEYQSFQLSFEQLYGLIRDKISADLGPTWKNESVICTSAEVLVEAAKGNQISAVGVKPIADILNYCTGYLKNNLSSARWS